MKSNQKILDHIKKYCDENDWECSEPDDYFLTLEECGKELYESEPDHHRWWYTVFVVVELDGMEIGFEKAVSTGDNSPKDCGWEFNLNSICSVEKREVVLTEYIPKR